MRPGFRLVDEYLQGALAQKIRIALPSLRKLDDLPCYRIFHVVISGASLQCSRSHRKAGRVLLLRPGQGARRGLLGGPWLRRRGGQGFATLIRVGASWQPRGQDRPSKRAAVFIQRLSDLTLSRLKS